jgi:hypothetical protein
LSNAQTTMSVMECKLQDSISKKPAGSKTRGSWDCEAGGELTDHISSVSTVSVGSIGQQNDEWVCDEGDETRDSFSLIAETVNERVVALASVTQNEGLTCTLYPTDDCNCTVCRAPAQSGEDQ